MHRDRAPPGHIANHLSPCRHPALPKDGSGSRGTSGGSLHASNRTNGSENGFHHFEDAAQHIRIVGNRTGYGDLTGSIGRDALLDQRGCIDQ